MLWRITFASQGNFSTGFDFRDLTVLAVLLSKLAQVQSYWMKRVCKAFRLRLWVGHGIQSQSSTTNILRFRCFPGSASLNQISGSLNLLYFSRNASKTCRAPGAGRPQPLDTRCYTFQHSHNIILTPSCFIMGIVCVGCRSCFSDLNLMVLLLAAVNNRYEILFEKLGLLDALKFCNC